jgi:hypothetical protein
MHRPVIGVVAERKGADVWAAPSRIGPADDDELLAIEALRFDPEAAIAWGISPVDALGNRAFERQPAGVLSEKRPITMSSETRI